MTSCRGDELVEAIAALRGDALLQRVGALTVNPEELGEVVDLQYEFAHRYISSAKRGDSRLKANVPNQKETTA